MTWPIDFIRRQCRFRAVRWVIYACAMFFFFCGAVLDGFAAFSMEFAFRMGDAFEEIDRTEKQFKKYGRNPLQ